MSKKNNFEKLVDIVGINNAESILNDLLSEKFSAEFADEEYTTDDDFYNFCCRFTGDHVDEILTDDYIEQKQQEMEEVPPYLKTWLR